MNKALTLQDLPTPPPEKSGWPWTEQSHPLPERMPDGSEWPRISIVTPSYNQGSFLEETIRSVLLQGYPNLEYIIIDGGSQDNSVEVIKRYAPFLAFWLSERDKGQTHAINKGINQATGKILAWLNSDDIYGLGALKYVSQLYHHSRFGMCYGKCDFIDSKSQFLSSWPYVPNLGLLPVLSYNLIPQPSCFLDRQEIIKYGLLDEGLQYAFDYEYWIRLLLRGVTIVSVPALLSKYRIHDLSKTQTSRNKFDTEMESVYEKLLKENVDPGIKRAIAKCYRRFSLEYYFWFNDKAHSMYYFSKMIKTDLLACNWLVLKVYIKNLLLGRWYAKS